MVWILLVLFYGLAKGAREVIKKKSLEKNTVLEVLVFYTLLSFIMVLPDAPNAGGITLYEGAWIALKSFFIFLAWILSFQAIRYLPVSYYGILDLSRVVFATLLGVFALGETMGLFQGIGLVLVLIGLVLLKGMKHRKAVLKDAKVKDANIKDTNIKDTGENVEAKYVIMCLLSCVFNAFSGFMDKLLMKELTSSQLQFWYMLFLVAYYLIYVLIKRVKINYRSLLKNYWIYILSILFVLADRALFVANGMEASKVTIMTLIKQSGCLVTIVAGKLVFHEKNIRYKLLCAGVIVAGIVIAVIP